MDRREREKCTQILKEELVPAMGCTEPIAIALVAAKAKQALGEQPKRAVLRVSGSIVKNAKSVVVPHTGGLHGLAAAFFAGLVAGNPDAEYQVLSAVSKQEIEKIREGVDKFPLTIERLDKGRVFDVEATLYGEMHTSHVRVCDTHMGLVLVKRDDEVLFERPPQAEIKKTDRAFLSVEKIFEYAGSVEIEEIKATLDRQIAYNTAIAEEGLKRDYGANVGKVILRSYQPEVAVKAKAYAAAASDARMNGCELPVIINSGSGNQGITASLPVIVYARELQLPMEKLYRALAVSNLVTVHLKSGIGTLSAYCGVVSAGAGAACGIAYLLGGGMEEISHALVNALAIDSGIVCDGAKASCAAKIAMAVESGILGLNMHYNGCEFYAGDGIVKDGVEPTIRSVSRLAQDGMRETNAEILRIMMEE